MLALIEGRSGIPRVEWRAMQLIKICQRLSSFLRYISRNIRTDINRPDVYTQLDRDRSEHHVLSVVAGIRIGQHQLQGGISYIGRIPHKRPLAELARVLVRPRVRAREHALAVELADGLDDGDDFLGQALRRSAVDGVLKGRLNPLELVAVGDARDVVVLAGDAVLVAVERARDGLGPVAHDDVIALHARSVLVEADPRARVVRGLEEERLQRLRLRLLDDRRCRCDGLAGDGGDDGRGRAGDGGGRALAQGRRLRRRDSGRGGGAGLEERGGRRGHRDGGGGGAAADGGGHSRGDGCCARGLHVEACAAGEVLVHGGAR
ncbi:hypothetical protein PG997_010572 [Apiospora hydei]|uniref:Uncharacterized protein n=1 Tax=Apiospora hydei TaxID=1337664 RepID=A0ABR1VKA2_9PEZI